jgi:23S rRNA (cytidine1920-2'-O)/16S rRNA (cytidine1409-2'-O)-methyltransferase
MKTRLDAELVRRELARSREQAADLIESRSVLVNGIPATKPATQVDAETSIVLAGKRDDFVSRGGHKLAGALEVFADVVVEGKVCLDAGASTGGFTDVLLRQGAKKVIAVDVGYGQLAWELRQDERVVILDRTNIRHLTGDMVGEDVEIVVADLSFISLSLVLPALAAVSKPSADFLLMVKPQFEVGRERLGAGGVVRDPALRRSAVLDVAQSAYDVGLGTMGVAASPLPGPAGNVEYFLWLRRGAPAIDESALDRGDRDGTSLMSSRKAILVVNATRPEAVHAATTLAVLLGRVL